MIYFECFKKNYKQKLKKKTVTKFDKEDCYCANSIEFKIYTEVVIREKPPI